MKINNRNPRFSCTCAERKEDRIYFELSAFYVSRMLENRCLLFQEIAFSEEFYSHTENSLTRLVANVLIAGLSARNNHMFRSVWDINNKKKRWEWGNSSEDGRGIDNGPSSSLRLIQKI